MPNPPDGFSWTILSEIKAAILLPDSWHVLKEENEGTRAYFLTREDISKEGMFKVGLSLNVVFNVKEKANVTAVEYAQAYSYAATQVEGVTLLQSENSVQGPFHNYLIRYDSVLDSKTATIHQLAIGNKDTDTLYIFMFEAPKAEWETAWNTGLIMMQGYFLDLSI